MPSSPKAFLYSWRQHRNAVWARTPGLESGKHMPSRLITKATPQHPELTINTDTSQCYVIFVSTPQVSEALRWSVFCTASEDSGLYEIKINLTYMT